MEQWKFRGRAYDCPVVLTIARLSGRWKTNILWLIWNGTNRFNAICRELPTVNKAVVSRQIRSMEQDELIERRVIKTKPLHVEYSLTESGRSLGPIIERLAAWGQTHSDRRER